MYFFFKCYGDHRDLHVRTHSFPPRRSADLIMPFGCGACDQLDLPFVESEALIGRARLRLDRPVVGEQDSLRAAFDDGGRSEEHTSELQSLMRLSYAVFCLKKKNIQNKETTKIQNTNSTISRTGNSIR